MKKYFKYLLFILLFTITNVYATPANDTFLDDNLYKCIIDTYNLSKTEKVDYNYNILPEELIVINSLNCSTYAGSIEDLTGLNKMSGLTSLNLSGNVFYGGSLNLKNTTSGILKSNINLPSNLSITNKTYKIDNEEILKIENDKIIALANGSTTVTMNGKVSGNDITEKYLVSINNENLKKSNNSKLASLYLSSGGDFKFNSDIFEYTIVVAESTSRVKINATLLDKKASFVSGFGPRDINLNIGTNKVLVKVKAEDESIKTYTLTIIRSEGSDENIRLTNIELSVGKIDFNPDVYIYSFTVDSNVNEIDVVGVAESTLSKVEVSDTKLKVGENKIIITVISESNNKKEYQLIVTREDYDSEYNYLKDLNIKNYKLFFNRNTFNYDLTIGFDTKLDILPVLENNESTYTIEGNNNLKSGSKIAIKVVDKEGSTRTYTINITKDLLYNISYKTIILLSEFLFIIILILILIFRKPNKPKEIKLQRKYMNTPVSTNKVCKSCGTINDPRSKTCYVCGRNI